MVLKILDTVGYVSKNILSRRLGVSLKESERVLSSFEPTHKDHIYYSKISENKVIISKDKEESSKVYAISYLKLDEAYKKEQMIKEEIYDKEDIVYPPADSGVYLQDKKERVKFSTFLHSSTVKMLAVPQPLSTRNVEEEKKEKKVSFTGDGTPVQIFKHYRKGTPFPRAKEVCKKNAENEENEENEGPVKKAKPLDEFFVPNVPVVVKRKVYKTRSFTQNGQIITEDYSDEEEIVINRTPMPFPKRKMVQNKLEFK